MASDRNSVRDDDDDDSEQLRSQLSELVTQHGVRGAAAKVGLHRETMLRFMARTPTHRGTQLLIRTRVQRFCESALVTT